MQLWQIFVCLELKQFVCAAQRQPHHRLRRGLGPRGQPCRGSRSRHGPRLRRGPGPRDQPCSGSRSRHGPGLRRDPGPRR